MTNITSIEDYKRSQNVIELVLPFPPAELHPNARPNRFAKAKAVKAYRYGVSVQALQQVRKGLERDWPEVPLKAPVVAEVTFWVHNMRRDTNNLDASLKALWDGLVDAHILAGDRQDQLRHATSIVLRGAREEVGVVLRGAS